MLQPSTTNSPKFDPEIAEQPESTSYNWQKWAKWGLLSAGGIVLTTAVMYYGGPTLVAGLSSLAAGLASRFKESGQETALSPMGHAGVRHGSFFSTQPKPNIVLNEFQEAEQRGQELIQSIEAHFQTEKEQKFLAELEEYEEDDEKNELAGFEELPLTSNKPFAKWQLMQISLSDSSVVNDFPTLVNNTLSIEKGGTVILTTEDLAATDPNGNDNQLIFTVSDVQHGRFEEVGNPGVAITNFTQQQVVDGEVQFVHDGGLIAPTFLVQVNNGENITKATVVSVIFKAVYVPLTDELSLQTTITRLYPRTYAMISKSEDGGFIMMYTYSSSSTMRYGQLFHADGRKRGDELLLIEGGSYEEDDLATLHDGKFIAVRSTGGREIHAHFFNPDGSTNKTQVITSSTNCSESTFTYPQVISLGDKFVLSAWVDRWFLWIGAYDIAENMYLDFVSDITMNEPTYSLLALNSEEFIVVWTLMELQQPVQWQIRTIEGGMVVHQESSDDLPSGMTISAAKLQDGKIALAFLKRHGSDTDVYIRLLHANGTIFTDSMFSGNTAATQRYPQVEALQGGGFIVSRISYLSNGPGWVSTQIHDSNGLQYNAETTVYASSECIDQNYYAMKRKNLLQLDDGKLVVAKGVDCDGGPYYRLLGNDTAPALVRNNLVINRESTKFTLTENNLSATDPDNDDSLLIFEVSDTWFGHFEFITAPEIVITSFTQQQLAEGRVRFIRDEFEDLPRYKVAVKDGIVSTSPTDAFIFETGSNSRLSTSLLSVSISQKSSASSSQSSSFITSSIHPDEPLSVGSQEVGRSSTLPAVDNGKNNAWIGVVMGLLGGLLFIGCLTGGGILYWRWKEQLAEEQDIDLEELEYVDNEPVPLIKRSELQFGKELGRGAAGTVFKGTWKGSEVAIKQLPLYMTEYDPQLLAEFKKETTVMCKLRHPNIVQFFGLYRDQEHYCIVMEYMSCGSLDRLLYNPQVDLPWRPARWRIIRDITYGLWYLHDQHPPLLHRDLKSQNILLDEQLRAKITDFGVAKITEDATKTMTKGIGTLCWMAPEVMRGTKATGKNYSNKADTYSYGMILWELAARELPYKDLNQFEIPTRVCQGERPEIPQDCPQPLAHLIHWCWQANPDIRPAMADAKRALDDIEESRDDNLIQFETAPASNVVC